MVGAGDVAECPSARDGISGSARRSRAAQDVVGVDVQREAGPEDGQPTQEAKTHFTHRVPHRR